VSVSARPEWQEWVPKVEAANAGTFSDVQTLERDPTYWLRLHYALRDGRLADASDAQRQLGALGFDVQLRDVHPASESHFNAPRPLRPLRPDRTNSKGMFGLMRKIWPRGRNP